MTFDQIKTKYIRMYIETGNGPRQAKRNAKVLTLWRKADNLHLNTTSVRSRPDEKENK